MLEVISPFPYVISDLINLTDKLAQLSTCVEILFWVHKYFSSHLFSNFDRSQTFFSFDCFWNKTSGLNLNFHKFHDINSLKSAPTLIKLHQIFPDLVDYSFKININRLLVYLAINVSQRMLKFEKFYHKFRPMIKYILSERILFTIDPQIWKSFIKKIITFLSTIQYFCQVRKLSFLVQDFICLWKIRSIISADCLCVIDLE